MSADPEYVACDVMRDYPHCAETIHDILGSYRTGKLSDDAALALLARVARVGRKAS